MELHALTDLFSHGLVGTGVILAGAVAGWRLGRRPERRAARLVAWWLRRVVRPLMASRSWWRRAVIIAANNSLTCALMVGLGAAGPVAWAAVAGVGVGLGLALRLMLTSPPEQGASVERGVGRQRVVTWLGVALNLLEIPAIALSAGLCLAQGALWPVLTWAGAWRLFGCFVLPALAIAAAGEALWMGVGRRSHRGAAVGEAKIN